MKHEISDLRIDGGNYGYICTCGERESGYDTPHDREDAAKKHQFRANYAQLNMGPRRPALKTVRKYYLERAEDPLCSQGEQALWKQLADELDRYMKRGPEDTEQINLF